MSVKLDFLQRVIGWMQPGALLIAGRTADSRWLAFRNLEPPPLQLWVEARDVPTFVPSTVGIVSCATAPNEFPPPR